MPEFAVEQSAHRHGDFFNAFSKEKPYFDLQNRNNFFFRHRKVATAAVLILCNSYGVHDVSYVYLYFLISVISCIVETPDYFFCFIGQSHSHALRILRSKIEHSEN